MLDAWMLGSKGSEGSERGNLLCNSNSFGTSSLGCWTGTIHDDDDDDQDDFNFDSIHLMNLQNQEDWEWIKEECEEKKKKE